LRSLDNWVSRLNLHCRESYLLGIFSSIEMFGFLICCVVFAPMSDVYGRKKFTLIGVGMYVLVYGIILLSTNLYVYMAVSFVNGFAIGFKSLIMYTLMMEYFPGKESLITGMLFFVDEGIFIWSPLMLVFVTK
jgi:MFS family permease